MSLGFDPSVLVTKTDTMRHACHLVAHGYHYWVGGEVEASRAARLVTKFDDLYEIGADRNRRARAHLRGKANAVLLLYPKSDSQHLRWWLLATAGSGPVHDREQLKDGRLTGQRIHWGEEYELVPATRAGRNRASWSWRMTAEQIEAWHVRISLAARSESPRLMKQAIKSLYRTPGFASCRSEVGRLIGMARKQWKASGRSAPFPATPLRLPYTRYRKAESQPLSVLLRRATRGAACWFGSSARHVVLDRQNSLEDDSV